MTYYAEGEPYGGNNLPPSRPYVEKSPGRTRQDDLHRCDINNIVARYNSTGELPVKNREAFFADVSSMPDFATAFEVMDKAREGFYSLSAEVKSRFENNPAKFVDFTSNPANRDELVSMGLIDAPGEVTAEAAIQGDLERESLKAKVEPEADGAAGS